MGRKFPKKIKKNVNSVHGVLDLELFANVTCVQYCVYLCEIEIILKKRIDWLKSHEQTGFRNLVTE